VRFVRWLDRQRARRDALLEAVVSALAARWPNRFGDLDAHVRASNAMLAELRAIQDATEAEAEGRPR
jgi:type IV secretion system protein VirD4